MPNLAAIASNNGPPSPEMSAKNNPARRPRDTAMMSANDTLLDSRPVSSSQTVPSVRTPSTSMATALMGIGSAPHTAEFLHDWDFRGTDRSNTVSERLLHKPDV